MKQRLAVRGSWMFVPVYVPNQACWSPWTSMARPKSASFTAAFLHLLARSKFSGWSEPEERHDVTNQLTLKTRKTSTMEGQALGRQDTYIQTLTQDTHIHKSVQRGSTSLVKCCRGLQRFGVACTLHLCGPDKTVSLIIHYEKMVLIMGCSPQWPQLLLPLSLCIFIWLQQP